MKRLRHLTALLLCLLLLGSVSGRVWAGTPNNGVVEPTPWTSTQSYDWYTALTVDTARTTGKAGTQHLTFAVKANVARLTITDNGVKELDVAVNGQRLHLNPSFPDGQGTAAFDISALVHYGVENTLDVQALAKPGESATIKVEAPAFNIRLIHMNDIHAKIDPLPKVAQYLDDARALGGQVLFVDGGDNFSGNAVSDLNAGVPMIELLNAMQADVMVVGNHDFDHGPENTQARRSESSFKWLSANTHMVDQSATPIQPFEPYQIFTNELGQKIAFVGLTQTPPATAGKNVVGLDFEDPVAVAQRYIAELRNQVNVLVLLSHNGADFDEAMAPQVKGTDLIIGAHSHTYLKAPLVVAGIPIVQAGSDATYLGDLAVRQAESVAVTAGGANGAYTVATKDLTVADATVKAIVDKWNASMQATLSKKIGYTPILMSAAAKYSQDVSVGNLITDAMRDWLNTDFAVTNNGGIRADIPAGDINMAGVYKVLPFGNIIQKRSITGANFRKVLEFSYNRFNSLDLQVSGASYVVYTKPGSKLLDHLDVFINGQPIDDNKTYTIAVQDYIGNGGSKYPFPTLSTLIDGQGGTDALIVGGYIQKVGNLNYQPTEGRIRIINQ